MRLREAVATYAPRLLVLDPFVRLHRIDENDAGQVSALLGYLRELQRAHDVAVLVVHHRDGPDARGLRVSVAVAVNETSLAIRGGRQATRALQRPTP